MVNIVVDEKSVIEAVLSGSIKAYVQSKLGGKYAETIFGDDYEPIPEGVVEILRQDVEGVE